MLYIKLFVAELKHKLLFQAVTTAAFGVLFYIGGLSIGNLEYAFVLFALAACINIFGENETDLLMLGRIQIGNVFLTRFFASFISVSLIPSFIILAFTNELRPMKAVLAFLVVVLFFMALGAFFRIVTGSALVASILSLTVFAALLFYATLGDYSPFYSMQIADINVFIINRVIYIIISLVFILTSVIILTNKDIRHTSRRS